MALEIKKRRSAGCNEASGVEDGVQRLQQALEADARANGVFGRLKGWV